MEKFTLICDAIDQAGSVIRKEEYCEEGCYNVYQGELRDAGFTIVSLSLLTSIKDVVKMWPEIQKTLPQETDKEQGQSQAIFVAFNNLLTQIEENERK